MPQEILAGRSTHVVRLGKGGDPTVGIHCSLGRAEMLLPLIKAMGSASKVTLFDLPGHGASEAWDDVAEYQLVAAQQALELCDRPTHLLGHSFGATVALRAALEAPGKVSRLTLIEPVYFVVAKDRPAYAGHRAAFVPFEQAFRDDRPDKAAEVFNGMWGIAPWDKLPEAMRKSLAEQIHLIPVTAPSIEDDVAGVLGSGALERLGIPVTLIRGSESPAIIADIHAALCEMLPNAQDHVIEGTAHMSPITHTKEVAEIISRQSAKLPA